MSRHRRLTTRQTRASERCCRRPGRRPKSCCARRPMQTLPPWPALVLPARHRLPKAAICIASRGRAAVEPPHGPQPAPSSSKATSKNAAQKVAVILRRPDLAVSGLREALCSSVSVPTRTAVAGGVVPAMTVLIWSPLDGTRHSDLLNRTQTRAGFEPSMSTHAEHKRTVLRLTVGRHSLGAACHPGCTGAGAGSALTWPLPAATLGLWLDPFAAPYASLTGACRQPRGIKLHVATL